MLSRLSRGAVSRLRFAKIRCRFLFPEMDVRRWRNGKALLNERLLSVPRIALMSVSVWVTADRPLMGSAMPTANVATWWLADVQEMGRTPKKSAPVPAAMQGPRPRASSDP